VQFLKKGFQEYNQTIKDSAVNEAVERLDGIPGWLTLYGNKVSVQKLQHKQALEETTAEASKIVKDELEHFLEGRDRQAYLAALKATATPSRWTEIKGAIQIAKASTINDGSVYRIIKNLKAAMLITEDNRTYRIEDPMLRTLLLSSEIT
jgi:AAA+ ATPase superfamily predicted ATPase